MSRHFTRYQRNRIGSLSAQLTEPGQIKVWIQRPKIPAGKSTGKHLMSGIIIALAVTAAIVVVASAVGINTYLFTAGSENVTTTSRNTALNSTVTSRPVTSQQTTPTETTPAETTSQTTTTTTTSSISTTKSVGVTKTTAAATKAETTSKATSASATKTANTITTATTTTTNERTTTTNKPTTTEAIQTTTASAGVVTGNSTDSSVTVTLNNVLPANVSNTPGIPYTLIVSSNPNNTSINDTNTWAGVQGLDPQPAYSAIYMCPNLFATGGSSCPQTTRSKRDVSGNVPQSVTLTIGGDKYCNKADVNVYCNGRLQPNKVYYVMYRAYDNQDVYDSPFYDVKTAVLGMWLEWGSWSSCDVTCGGGVQKRYRPCPVDTYCPGLDSELRLCNVEVCPFVATTGVWEPWSTWTECSQSCGGGVQTRDRECDKGSRGLDCVGNNTQSLACNQWLCPDCQKICTTGNLRNCAYCDCGETIHGKVTSEQGYPINDVKITLEDVDPDVIIGKTGLTGHFTLNMTCPDHRLVFQKSGYVSKTVLASVVPDVLSLYARDELTMDVHPVSKMRTVGEEVMFCCSALGDAVYYEWFKDEQQLPEQSGSTLRISNVSLDDSGSYRCRANSYSQSMFSSAALLTVRVSSNEFCPDAPDVKYITLPEGCDVNDSTVYNVGQCAMLNCHGNTVYTNDTCQEKVRHCCSGISYQKINIQCSNYNYTLFKVTQCGCSQCVDPTIKIQGVVLTADRNFPVKAADIYFNKSIVAQTNSDGRFVLELPITSRRIAITASAPGNESVYSDGTQVLTPSGSLDGEYHVTIKLKRAKLLDKFDSQNESIINLSTEKGKLADVKLTAGGYVDADGNEYKGIITPKVTLVDPREDIGLSSAPSDFTTVQEGELERLQSYGMISISLLDERGRRVQKEEQVEVEMSSEAAGTDSPLNPMQAIKLYKLDPLSGSWTEQSELNQQQSSNSTRSRRQVLPFTFVIPGITISQIWYNFDAVSQSTCYSKIRLFEDDGFEESGQVSGGVVSILVKGDDGTYSLSQIRAADDVDSNGYSVAHRCNSPRSPGVNVQYEGIITAETADARLKPANENTGLGSLQTALNYRTDGYLLHANLDYTAVLASNGNGPIYDWNHPKWRYTNATTAPFEDRHFKFYIPPEEKCYQHQETVIADQPTSDCNPLYYVAWHSAREVRNQAYTACYIKVSLPSLASNIKVQAFSKVGDMFFDNGDLEIKPGNDYGYREDCNQEAFVCIEVKQWGKRGCSTKQKHDIIDPYTHIVIKAFEKTPQNSTHLTVTEVNPDLLTESTVNSGVNSTEFSFNMDKILPGIFCHNGETSAVKAEAEARSKCQQANSAYAVRFGEKMPNCQGNIVLILDTSGSMRGSLNENKRLMRAIADNFLIGEGRLLVSLLFVYSYVGTTIWNLESDVTKSNAALQLALDTFDSTEATGSYSQLPATLSITNNDILPTGQSNVVVMFWDGDRDLSMEAKSLQNKSTILSVAPTKPTSYRLERIESVVLHNTTDVFYLDSHTVQDFIDRLKQLLNCS